MNKLHRLVVDLRFHLTGLIVALTVFFGYWASQLTMDSSFKSMFDTESPEYVRYEEFVRKFGHDEVVLMTVTPPSGTETSEVLQGLDRVAKAIESQTNVRSVTCVANIELLDMRDGALSEYPLLVSRDGRPQLPDSQELAAKLKTFPFLALLVSPDSRTFGVAIHLDDASQFDLNVGGLLGGFERVARKNLPSGSDIRMIGPPVTRAAFLRYNMQTGAFFGLIGLAVCLVSSLYVFKSFAVAAMSAVIGALGVVWVLGFMAVSGAGLNMATSLSVGLVMIVSISTVIHIVTHFNIAYPLSGDKTAAAKASLRTILGPCFMCALTTALGFATIIISPLPMIRQLGVIMSVGVVAGFILAIVLTPAFLTLLKPVTPRQGEGMKRDAVSRCSSAMESLWSERPRACVAAGVALGSICVAGIALVRANPEFLNMFDDKSPEIRDLRYVEERLTPVHSLNVVLSAGEDAFLDPETWRRAAALEKEIRGLEGVAGTDSLVHLMEHLYEIASGNPSSHGPVFDNPLFIPQMLEVIRFHRQGAEFLAKFLSETRDSLVITVRVRNPKQYPLRDTIERIQRITSEWTGQGERAIVTGELAVASSQRRELVRSQTISLLVALAFITALMMLQLRSVTLGLLSLVPNLFPILAIFGAMGLMGVELDHVTIFVAAISIGLSVDGTIHFLTPLARYVRENDGGSLTEKLKRAHAHAGRAVISTTTILALGMLALYFSPFRPVASFGSLAALAIVVALLGDLLFMPAFILSTRALRETFGSDQ